MADTQRGAVSSASQNASRPYFTQRVRLNSLHAQQVFDRGFDIGANAIFSLSIILRVIGTDEQAQERLFGEALRLARGLPDRTV